MIYQTIIDNRFSITLLNLLILSGGIVFISSGNISIHNPFHWTIISRFLYCLTRFFYAIKAEFYNILQAAR